MADTYPIRIPDRLPKKIDPCPIVDSLFEVRFVSNVPSQAVLGMVYQKLRPEFPGVTTLPLAAMPEATIQANPTLLFQAHYRLEGERFVMLVGPRSVSVAIKGAYPGWNAMFPKFIEIIDKVLQTELIANPGRFGLRYINFFPRDVLSRLVLSFSIQNQSISGRETFFKTILDWNTLKVILQVGKDVLVTNNVTGQVATGSVIDIDCFTTPNNSTLDRQIREFLEVAHTAEKQLFFGLLNPDFLDEFHPEYDVSTT